MQNNKQGCLNQLIHYTAWPPGAGAGSICGDLVSRLTHLPINIFSKLWLVTKVGNK